MKILVNMFMTLMWIVPFSYVLNKKLGLDNSLDSFLFSFSVGVFGYLLTSFLIKDRF